MDAKKAVDERNDVAKKALSIAIKERPAMISRDPSLHLFSMMAFEPVPIEGKAIKLHPLVVKGFNADFDGDAMGVHIPITDEAVREAHGMMPSKHLLKPGTGSVMVMPSNEIVLGIYFYTKEGKKTTKA